MPCCHGLIIIVDEPSARELQAPLQAINVKATTCGPIAHNTIKFCYKNTNDTAIRSRFVFPVNSQSSIYSLTATVGGRKIVGKVKEKEAAQADYDKAVESGKSAVIAKESKEAGDIIELELGAFGKGESAEIVIKEIFEMKLIKKATCFQYKFPTSMFVRYGGGVTQEVSRQTFTDYHLNFEIDCMGVKSVKPKAWLGSETNNSNFKFNNNRKVFEKDHDVVLELGLAENFKGFRMVETWRDLSVLTEQDTDQRLLLTSILVNIDPVPVAELPAKEYVFVIDCSGSMMGQRMEDAKKTLQSLINSLPVGSKFNVVRFGSSYEKLFRSPKDYNKDNKQIAIQLAETMDANLGGTEMYNCLKSVLEDKRSITQFKRQIFVLTDGGIHNQAATLKLVADNSAENRIFSFGIGSGCSTALVNGLAEQGKGTASFIADKSGFSWDKEQSLSEICIKSVMASASQHISKIEVTPAENLLAPKTEISMVVDSTCLNVFHSDETAQVALKMTKATEEEALTTETTVVGVKLVPSPFESNALHKLAAKKIISQMVNEIKAQDPWTQSNFSDKKKAVIELSVKEQVLSPYTALVGVADEATVVGVSQRVDVGNGPISSRPPFNFGCAVQAQCAPRNRSVFSFGATRRERAPPPPPPCSNSFGSASRFQQQSYCAPPPPPPMMNCMAPAMSSFGGGNLPRPMLAGAACPPPPPPPGNAQTSGLFALKADTLVQRRCRVASESESSSDMGGFDAGDFYRNSTEEEDDAMDCTEIITPGNPRTLKLSDTHQTITNAQDPAGFWSDLASFDLAPELLAKIKSAHSDVEVVGTIYALVLLIAKFSDGYDEWKLSAIKGCGYLKRKLGQDAAEQVKAVDWPSIDDEMVDELFE